MLDTKQQELEELKTRITRINAGRLQTGEELKIIHEKRLFKLTHKSWRDFISETFGKSHTWSYDLMKDVEAIRKASDYEEIVNIYQAKALATVELKYRPGVVQFLNQQPDKLTAISINEVGDAVKEVNTTGHIEIGDDGQFPPQVVEAIGFQIAEAAYERKRRQEEHIKASQKDNDPDYESDLPALEALTATMRNTLNISIDDTVHIRVFKDDKGGKIYVENSLESVRNTTLETVKSVRNADTFAHFKDLASRERPTAITHKLRSQVKIKDLKDKRLDSTGKEPVLSSAKAEKEIHAHTHIPAQDMRIFPFRDNGKTLTKPKPVTSAKPSQQAGLSAAIKPASAKKPTKKRKAKRVKTPEEKAVSEAWQKLQQAIQRTSFGDDKPSSFARSGRIAKSVCADHDAKTEEAILMLLLDVEVFPKWYQENVKNCNMPRNPEVYCTNFNDMLKQRAMGKPATSEVRSMKNDPLALKPSD